MNRDGALDLVLVEAEFLSVLLGDGRGALRVWQTAPLGTRLGRDVQVRDLNGDWEPDIVLLGTYAPDVSLFLGDGTGGFGAARSSLIGRPLSRVAGQAGRSLAVADVTGDGVPDVAVPVVEPDQIVVLPGTLR